ncbi:uncharacterized protein LOC144653539 [Oculina patagonica]
MDAVEQNDYDVFRRDVYRVDVSNEYESQQNRRIVRSIGDNDDDEDFDDLEALRLAALKSLGTKNSYAKSGSSAADLSSTRHVSLGREDKSDLQIVALERQASFSSSSTDYEEIDLSEQTFPDSEANDSDSDVDVAESEEKFQSDSPRDDQEMDENEDSDQGDDKYDVENNDVATDEENNDILTDEEEVGENDVSIDEGDIENNVLSDEDNMENNILSDEDIDLDTEENLQNNSETLEDDLHVSDNEINILNDISITIANESLVSAANMEEHLEIGDEDEVEGNSELNQEEESDNESANEHHLTSSQRIVVSQSDDESDDEVPKETETIKENQSAGESEMIVDSLDKKEKKVSMASSVTTSSDKTKTKVLPVTKGKPKDIVKVAKAVDLNVKPSQTVAKTTSSKPSTAEKPKLVTSSNLKKDSTQEVLTKEKTVDKAKEPRNDKGPAKKGNENVLNKAVNQESKVMASGEKESKGLLTEDKTKAESEEKMDFDQLSIEDEDSDFEEEEENQPAVKSKVGLNKIPTENSKRKRSYSRDNDRKRHSHSPERSRTSSRSYRNRFRDQRSRDRSRDRFNKRRSHSPSTDRTRRGNENRYQRSRSRERKQNRISSVRGRDRESRPYRSRSRSNSRPRGSRTEKEVKSNAVKPVKKESIRSSVKERLDIKKKINARPLSRSPKKEIRTQDRGDEEKNVKVKQAKSSRIELKIANGSKAVSKPTIQRDVDGIIIKQPKDLRSRLLEKKGDPSEVHIKKDLTVKEPTKIIIKERKVNARIQLSKPQKEVNLQRTNESTKKESTAKGSTDLVRERELDARIQRIQQQNEAILKRAKEIQAEKMKFHS